jgi:hypothetical protein
VVGEVWDLNSTSASLEAYISSLECTSAGGNGVAGLWLLLPVALAPALLFSPPPPPPTLSPAGRGDASGDPSLLPPELSAADIPLENPVSVLALWLRCCCSCLARRDASGGDEADRGEAALEDGAEAPDGGLPSGPSWTGR